VQAVPQDENWGRTATVVVHLERECNREYYLIYGTCKIHGYFQRNGSHEKTLFRSSEWAENPNTNQAFCNI